MRIVISVVVVLGCLGIAKGCSSGYHVCYSYSSCIPNSEVCDGKEDCYYGDDEENCGTTTYLPESTTRGNSCPEGQYECLNGLCIPDTWVCDGTTDCPTYGDDEQSCSRISYTQDSANGTSCPDDKYHCIHSGWCIAGSHLCDGWEDCPYADDEKDCNSTHSNVPNIRPKGECENSFDYIHDRCVLVEPFTATSWHEARYLCERLNSDLVVLDDYNFYSELLQFIRNKGLDSKSYWVGATDEAVEGTWIWVDFSPVPSGAPLWALYGCTGDYQLEPSPSDAQSQDCGFLDDSRGLHLSDASCSESLATICQARSSRKQDKDTIKKELSIATVDKN